MENNEQKIIVNEELVTAVGVVLLPAIQSMFDENNKLIDQKFAESDKRIDEKFAENNKLIDEKFVASDQRTEEKIYDILLKFSDEILFPAMQTMSDETNEQINALRKETNNRFDEHETLIYRLIENGEKTERRLNRIENKLDGLARVENENIRALGEDVIKINKVLKRHELRLCTLEA